MAKDAARSEAIRRWPAQAGLFARVKDDGRAEAALIAVAGLARLAKIAGGALISPAAIADLRAARLMHDGRAK